MNFTRLKMNIWRWLICSHRLIFKHTLILVLITTTQTYNFIYASAPKPKIKDASNLRSKHKMEYQDCKALFRFMSL
jgi:hypothetical protein